MSSWASDAGVQGHSCPVAVWWGRSFSCKLACTTATSCLAVSVALSVSTTLDRHSQCLSSGSAVAGGLVVAAAPPKVRPTLVGRGYVLHRERVTPAGSLLIPAHETTL
jgi:hypothetical protein